MNLYYQVDGSGADIVLLTGLAGSTRYWNHIVDELVARGFRVIRLDLLGFGRSPRLKRKEHYDIHTNTVAVISTLQTLEVKNAVIVGYSLSTSVALHLAASHPKLCKRAVLLCPPVYSSPEQAEIYGYQTGDLPRWLLDSIYARIICNVVCRNPLLAIPAYRIIARSVPHHVRDDARLHTWKSYRESFDNLMLKYSAEEDLAWLSVPLAIVYGSSDRSIEAAYLQSMPASNSHIQVYAIPQGIHQLPHQKPDVVLQYITGTTDSLTTKPNIPT